jgi:transposase
MHRFIDGEDRMQPALLPHCLEDYVSEENPVRVIEAFIDELDLAALGFTGMTPAATGRPAYHPSTLLKIYLYGYLNRVQSSRRLEREHKPRLVLPEVRVLGTIGATPVPSQERTWSPLK